MHHVEVVVSAIVDLFTEGLVRIRCPESPVFDKARGAVGVRQHKHVVARVRNQLQCAVSLLHCHLDHVVPVHH